MAPRSSRSLLALVTPLLLCFLAGMALAGQPVLSPGERQWLASLNRDIRIGITVIPPQIVHDGGTYEGLSLDYIRLLERKLDHRFKLVPLPTWNDVIEAARERRIDIIFAAQKTPERLAYLNFTEPYIDLPNIILTRKDRAGAEDLQIMNEWSIAISKGSAVHEYLQKEFPHLDLRPVPDELKGLQQVSLGEVDAMVLEISRASYYIEKEGILLGTLTLINTYKFSTFGLPATRNISTSCDLRSATTGPCSTAFSTRALPPSTTKNDGISTAAGLLSEGRASSPTGPF